MILVTLKVPPRKRQLPPLPDDPLSRLIQLDGLSKNQSKKPNSAGMGMGMNVGMGQNPYGQNNYTANPGFHRQLTQQHILRYGRSCWKWC
jgi:hypothetical protein